MQDEEILARLRRFDACMLRDKALQESVLNIQEQDAWLTALKQCAVEEQEMYKQNSIDLGALFDILQNGQELLTNAQYDLLLDEAQRMYGSEHSDLIILHKLAGTLEEHYVRLGDVPKLIQVYTCLAYTNIELSREAREDFGARSVVYNRKIMALGEGFWGRADMDDIDYRRVAVAYINMLVVETALCNLSMDEAYDCWLHLRELRNGPAFAPLASRYPRATEMMDMAISRFEAGGYGIYRNNNKRVTCPKVVDFLEHMNHVQYRKALEEATLLECDPDTIITHLEIGHDKHPERLMQVWRELEDYMYVREKTIEPQRDDVISFYVTGLQDMVTMLTEANLPPEEARRKSQKYMEMVERFISNYDRDANHEYSLNNALAALCFETNFYAYMDTVDEKLHFIYHLVLNRHVATYLHSRMVALFAQTMVESVLKHRPELMVGFHGIASAEEAVARSGELLHFAWNAGHLHDVGKNNILSTIDTQFRPLSDEEISLIRMHPDMGAKLLQIDAELAQFSDIVRGHHRFYNGQGGYPADFDNCASPDRIMIDIITLSDCLDAATDSLGRNYRRAKKVPQVLDEFAQGAGTRYNPDLVQLLLKDKALQERLIELAGPERERISVAAHCHMSSALSSK